MKHKMSALTITLYLSLLFTYFASVECSSLRLAQSRYVVNCNDSSQCNPTSYEVFYCEDSKCTCPQLYEYVPDVGRAMCLVPAQYGEACKYDVQCQDEYTYCGDDWTCECKKAFWWRGGNCENRYVWEGGSITGVVLACIFPFGALAGLIAFLIYRMDKNKLKQFGVQNRGIAEQHSDVKKEYEKLEEEEIENT